MKPITRARRGFTLWEMAMVLIILAVLTSLAIPAFVQLGANKHRTSVDLLIDLINESRRVAIRHNVNATLLIDPETGNYRLDTVGTNGLGLVVQDSLELGVAERIESAVPRLRYMFRPTGAAFADSALVRATEGEVMVVVDRWSGAAYARSR